MRPEPPQFRHFLKPGLVRCPPKDSKALWVGPPHWFRKERLIVLYVGDDKAVLELLRELMDPQFAGP